MSFDTGTEADISADLVFDLLSSQRRRMVLYYLQRAGGPVTVKEISEEIAAMENDLPVSELSRQQQKRVYVSLYQTHLPKLSKAGVIEYDRDEGIVGLTGRGAEIDQYLETGSQTTYPWALHYLVLGVLGVGLLILTVIPNGPFQVPTFWVGLAITVVIGVSAIVQYLGFRNKARLTFDRLSREGRE